MSTTECELDVSRITAGASLDPAHQARVLDEFYRDGIALIQSQNGSAANPEDRKLIEVAREELESIPPSSSFYQIAQNHLHNRLFAAP